mgnify:CR=1 FL=1
MLFRSVKAMPGLRIRWLGTFGYEISDAQTTILIDPFITRPKPAELLKPIVIDTSAVQHYLLSMVDLNKLAAILVTHSHYDHLEDVPFILAQFPDANNRPIVAGDPNTARIIQSYKHGSGIGWVDRSGGLADSRINVRSEEHTSELQHALISYAVFCLKKKKKTDRKSTL